MTSDGSADVDDYLDEALEDESESETDSYSKQNVTIVLNDYQSVFLSDQFILFRLKVP